MKRYGPFQDFVGGELRNWRFQNLGAAPSTPVIGQPYFDTAKGGVFIWNGTAQRPTDAALLLDGSIHIAALEVDPRARGTHTGTQLAETISDLSTTVKAYTLDSFAAPMGPLSIGNQRLALVGNALLGTDAPNLNQVSGLITAAIQGINAIKQPVRVAAPGNVTLSGLQTVDGVTLVDGDRILTPFQTNAAQRLIYVVHSGAWTIALDDDGSNELIEGTQVLVNEGSIYNGATFRITTQGAINPGTTSVTWTQTAQATAYTADEATLHLTGTQFSARLGYGLTTVAAGIQVLAVSTGGLQVTSSGLSILLPANSGLVSDNTGLHIDISSTIATARITQGLITGNGSATTFTITHNLGTKRVIPAFRDNADNGVEMDWTATDPNYITVTFGLPPANGVTFPVAITG